MPDSANPRLERIARRLLSHEAAAGGRATDPETHRVWKELRDPLEKLIGVNGFRSLMTRALALASAEVPVLRALEIKPDGPLPGLNESGSQADTDAFAAGEVALLSHLLGLLVTFIGSGLTLALLHDIWPKLDDPDF